MVHIVLRWCTHWRMKQKNDGKLIEGSKNRLGLHNKCKLWSCKVRFDMTQEWQPTRTTGAELKHSLEFWEFGNLSYFKLILKRWTRTRNNSSIWYIHTVLDLPDRISEVSMYMLMLKQHVFVYGQQFFQTYQSYLKIVRLKLTKLRHPAYMWVLMNLIWFSYFITKT